jgi:hypothetical protein
MPTTRQQTPRVNSGADFKRKALKAVCALLGCMVLAALLGACGSFFGLTDGPGDGRALKAEQMANEMVNKLDKKVTLTYTKIAKVRKILTAYYKKHMGPEGKEGGPAPEKPDKKMETHEEMLELDLSLVLNKKEMAAYKELAREQKEEMKKQPPASRRGRSGS